MITFTLSPDLTSWPLRVHCSFNAQSAMKMQKGLEGRRGLGEILQTNGVDVVGGGVVGVAGGGGSCGGGVDVGAGGGTV